MPAVVAHAKRGAPVLAICNGFQIACEAGLLPGALLRNDSLRFVCDTVHLRVESIGTRFTSAYHIGQVVRIPVAHGDGRYTADGDVLARLEGEGRVVFRYVDAAGHVTDAANPNGSARNIAGIVNDAGNVLGMMPHPERSVDARLGSADGLPLFRSLADSLLAEVGA
jgi:phosphoribosylformylglycinamidine synthase